VHLEEVGFESAPRFLGVDAQGREVLTFIEGEVHSECRATVWDDAQLERAAELLRCFHDATAGFDLAGKAEVICHHDFGPWNLIWRDGLPVAMIDFDNAAPGARLDDLGYAIWKHLNLGLIELPASEQQRRLRLMATAYGLPADEPLLRAIEEAQERMGRLIENAPSSIERDQALSQNSRERDWLRANRRLLGG
jgi:aminoglycoside phosphotransferase (APT) family kinase protein